MNKKINLPFTNKSIKGGQSFKILSDKEVSNSKNGILNIIQKMIKSNSSTSNKINYIKGSNTKEYYKNISK